ncbi:hypothetical protein M0638_26760 [Roseomonas sp. NAR14]|uniref:Uncharacterized protein n=1 Tax=Roseomonas acroporae TaxID=2937791 RepID=A0A9X2BY37_9PROT|nr:hypothetical protein [Roseomonas acroporae]MCK8787961.1 hypothetical protein [Roseomonas acroporae]
MGNILLAADAALRLGPRAIGHWFWHRLRLGCGVPQRSLARQLARQADAAAAREGRPAGRFLAVPSVPTPPPDLPAGARDAVLAAIRAAPAAPGAVPGPAPGPAPDWHGPFAAHAPSLGLDLFGPGDVRPV